MTTEIPPLTAGGKPLPTGDNEFGWLRDSNALLGNVAALQESLDEDGYLFLPGFLNREEVKEGRRIVLEYLAQREDIFDPEYPLEDGVFRDGVKMNFRPDLANDEEVGRGIRAVAYSPKVLGFYEDLFGEPVRHYDFSWLRAVTTGGTHPHCDSVYMNRGTTRVMTAWIPFGDVPLTVGGLVILEGSHKDAGLLEDYCPLDVDTVCEDSDGQNQLQRRGYQRWGAISNDFETVRARRRSPLAHVPGIPNGRPPYVHHSDRAWVFR